MLDACIHKNEYFSFDIDEERSSQAGVQEWNGN